MTAVARVLYLPLNALVCRGENRSLRNVDQLARSLRTTGLLQPIVVRPMGEGCYEIVGGHRRLEAAKLLGWATIAAMVLDLDETSVDLEFARLAENVARENLTPAELARTLARLTETREPQDIAKAVGLSTSHVRNMARLARSLSPDAWVLFEAEGTQASTKRWLRLASWSHDAQNSELFGTPESSPAFATERLQRRTTKRPSPKELRRRLKTLPIEDAHGRALLGWALGLNDWPQDV